MRITRAEFYRCAATADQFPPADRPEVAFAGRSNVGKSSLLNVLLGQRNLAKTSKTPGKTRTVNFYDVNGRFRFVDLPGYGFAQVARAMQEAWRDLVLAYLCERRSLRLVCHLVDARHDPTPKDHELHALLRTAQRPVLVVATKTDKLNSTQRTAIAAHIRECLGLPEDVAVLGCSAAAKQGVPELWRAIEGLLLPG